MDQIPCPGTETQTETIFRTAGSTKRTLVAYLATSRHLPFAVMLRPGLARMPHHEADEASMAVAAAAIWQLRPLDPEEKQMLACGFGTALV